MGSGDNVIELDCEKSSQNNAYCRKIYKSAIRKRLEPLQADVALDIDQPKI
jgi:hypothetical protein